MKDKGQIIITDLLLYIIILTIILAIVAYSFSILNDNQVTRINNIEKEKILLDTLDTLTLTSGKPTNWEKTTNTNNVETVGLKSTDTNQISYDKLNKLKNNPQLLLGFFPDNIEYSLTIYPKNNNNNKVLLAGKSSLTSKKQILSKDRPVTIDYGYDVLSFKNIEKIDSCPYDHNNSWTCKAITLNDSSLSEGNYYLITDQGTQYILSNTYLENITANLNSKECINNKLNQLKSNQNQTIYIHVKTKTNNTYLVYDTHDREDYLYTVIKPEIYVLNLKIAS